VITRIGCVFELVYGGSGSISEISECVKPNGFSSRHMGKISVEVHKALMKELIEFPAISSIHSISGVHDFYNNLSRDEEVKFCAKFGLNSDGQAGPCPRSARSEK